MPKVKRSKPKQSKHEKEQAAAIRREQKEINRLAKSQRKFRARIGNDAYDSAYDRFGAGIIRRATEAYYIAEKKREKSKREYRLNETRRLVKKGFTKSEIGRTISKGRKRKAFNDILYKPVVRGPKSGLYEKVFNGKRISFVSKKDARKGIWREKLHKKYTALAGAFDLSISDARKLHADINKKADKALSRIKKTAKYKNLSEKRKAGYTKKRFRRGAYAALAALIGVDSK